MKLLLPIAFSILIFSRVLANDSTDIVINKYSEKIVVHSLDSGFTRYISIHGTCNRETYFMPASIDQLNDSLSGFKLFYKKKKRYDEVENAKLMDSPGFSHFHDTQVIKLVELDSGNKFQCTFRIDCKKLILFSSIIFSSLYNTDTANYLVVIPAGLAIKFDWVNSDLLVFHDVSQFVENETRYLDVTVKPLRIKAKNNPIKHPALRLIIVPKVQEKSEDEYFNNWYLSGSNGISLLNPTSKIIIDSIAAVNSDTKNSISVYYDYIKKGFKYLDVMVGMGAFIPRDVNTVLNNRQGDCKDLANLLCAILKYKGYDANVAFAATNSYSFDFNFPSLCSGNHMICTVKIDSVLLLLDPTDINHQIGQPVQSLQGKTIFVTNSKKPYYYSVPILSQNDNRYTIQLSLKSGNNMLKGDFSIIATGYLFNDFKWMAASYSQKEFLKTIEYKLHDIFHDQSIDSVKYQIYPDSITMHGKIKYFNKYFEANNLTYLFLDYMPGLFSNQYDENKITEEAFWGTTMNKKFTMQVSFEDSIKGVDFVPFSVISDSYSMDFNVKKQNEKTISVNYQFIYNKTWINTSDIENLNSLIDNFNKKTHETVVIRL